MTDNRELDNLPLLGIEARGLAPVHRTAIRAARLRALHLLVDATVPDARISHDLEAAARFVVRTRPIDAALEDVFVRLTKLQKAAA